MADQDVNSIMDYAFDNKPIQFKSAFNDAMKEKLADVISTKYDEVVNIDKDEDELAVSADDIEDAVEWDADDELTPQEELELDNDEDV